jgi:hypothetical protein
VEETITISTANWFSVREAAYKIATNRVRLTHREARVLAGFPMEVFISVGRFLYSPSWNARLRSAHAAGLGWRVPCPWHGRSCRENRLQHDGTLLRTRDVLPPDYVRLSFSFSHVGRRISTLARAASIVAEWSVILVLMERIDLYRPQ